MSVKLQILGDVNKVIELKDHINFPLSINYVVADLKSANPTESKWRAGTFSNQFNVPATADNNKSLNDLYNANISDGKGLKAEKDAIIIDNGIPTHRGKFKVLEVTSGNTKEYQCLFKGNNLSWVKDLKNTSIRDLSWGTHTYNKSTIKASWSGTAATLDYFYGVVNYGQWSTPGQVKLVDLRPSVYFKSILTKAFNSIGYTFSSTFWDLDQSEKLIYPYIGNNWQISEETLDEGVFSSRLNTAQITQLIVLETSTKMNFQATDNSGVFDVSNDKYTVNHTTKYAFNYDFKFKVEQRGKVRFDGGYDHGLYFHIYKNGVLWHSQTLVNRDSGEAVIKSKPNLVFSKTGVTNYLSLTEGDELEFYLFIKGTASNQGGFTPEVTMLAGTAISNEPDGSIQANEVIDLSLVLPDENVMDIINGLTHCFNLYWRTDNATMTVECEPFRPYNDIDSNEQQGFYDTLANAEDFSSKLDLSKPFTIKFLSEYQKKLRYAYKTDDKDGYLNELNRAQGYRYGSYVHTFTDDRFAKGEEVSENPYFAFTYFIFDKSIARKTEEQEIDTGSGTEIRDIYLNIGVTEQAPVMARMWTEYALDNAPPVFTTDFSPRILYKSYDQQLDADGNNIEWFFEGEIETLFPTGLSVGGAYVTQVDLSYNGAIGLVKNYYLQQLNIIENGLLFDAYFKIDRTDALKFDTGQLLKKVIYVHSPAEIKGYYLINQVLGYEPLKNRTTKVELIKFDGQNVVFDGTQEEGLTGKDKSPLTNPQGGCPVLEDSSGYLMEVKALINGKYETVIYEC